MTDALNVLIATAGRSDLLARTLDSLAACEKPASFGEVVVVENGPPCGARDDVEQRDPSERVRYMHVDYANKSHALNEALGTLGDGLVVMLDDDVRLVEDILLRYAAAAGRRREGAFFGGSCNVEYEARPPEWLRRLLPLSARGYDLSQPEREWHLYLGMNWAAFARDLRAVGGFDPNFGPGSPTGSTGQEANMQERLLAHGLEAVDVPDAWCWHYVPRARSTLRWVLQRKYRGGIQNGLDPSSGAEASMLTRLVQSAASIGKRAVLLDRAGLWQAVAATYYWAGVVQGVRRRARATVSTNGL